jgi:hypothetical protein
MVLTTAWARLAKAGTLAAVLACTGSTLATAQQLPSEPRRQFGQSITGAFEGWYDNADGTHTFLVGYLNRNTSQPLDVPVGPNNHIDPGGPDLGQPTHFLPGRQYGMFTVTVPKDFSPQSRLTWTIVANGQTNVIPFRLHTDYNVTPFSDIAVHNTPPQVRFEERGPAIQGPIAVLSKAATRRTALATPLAITVWGSDDAKYTSGSNAPMRNPAPPPVTLTWSKYRGPGDVKFDNARPAFEKLPATADAPFNGKATTTATFGAPGDYVLHVTANDYSGNGGGGEVCCWTTAMLKVTVTP